MTQPTITVLTPTYNRSELLKQCYASLQAQTCHDFEWLIIDDGSTDGTRGSVKQFLSETGFHVEYHSKKNGGKHSSLNYAHEFIHGRYTIILDDDDTLTSDAIETIKKYWEKYDQEKKIWCLSFQRIQDGKPIQSFGDAETISNHIDFRIIAGRPFDCAEVMRSDIFKTYSFPVFANEKFIGEDCMWTTLAKDYDTVYIDKGIYICYYLPGGLTLSGRKFRLASPQGGMFRSNIYLNKRFPLKLRAKHAVLYDVFAFASKDTRRSLRKSNNKLLSYCLLPAGYFVYKKWNK
jgi:glycosyltransferase involved in cell wall biosynthesis